MNYSYLPEQGSKPVAQYTVPYRGTWSSLAANQIAADALYASLNVYIRRGKLRERPGLSLLNATVFDNNVIGGAMAVMPSGKIMLAVTKAQLYTLSNVLATWQVDTIAEFSLDERHVDITFLETESVYAAILANISHTLKVWIQGSGATDIVPQSGQTVPQAKSVCTAASRIIALVDPHTIRWSATKTYDNWPALATVKVSQTNDIGIAVRSIGTLAFVVYKERSIYIARAQQGDDATAFNIQFFQSVEGPASMHAIVDIGNGHMYMTKNGRIGVFNGTSYVQWIADGLWLFLQNDIDPVNAYNIFGVFDYRLHTVTFYYCKLLNPFGGGFFTGMVVVNLPLEGSGISQPSAFIGISQVPCTYAYEMRFADTIDRSLIFSGTLNDQQSFVFDDSVRTDDGLSYSCSMQTALLPLPEMKHFQLSVESFFERADGNGSVTVSCVTSDMLESESGTVSEQPQVIDLNSNPVREYQGFNVPSRYYGLKYEWQSDSIVRYAGANVYGRPLV